MLEAGSAGTAGSPSYVATCDEPERYENLRHLTQRHIGEDTTVARHRAAVVNFREAHETAIAKGEVVTQSIPPKDRVRQGAAGSQLQQRQQSQQATVSTDRPDAYSQ